MGLGVGLRSEPEGYLCQTDKKGGLTHGKWPEKRDSPILLMLGGYVQRSISWRSKIVVCELNSWPAGGCARRFPVKEPIL